MKVNANPSRKILRNLLSVSLRNTLPYSLQLFSFTTGAFGALFAGIRSSNDNSDQLAGGQCSRYRRTAAPAHFRADCRASTCLRSRERSGARPYAAASDRGQRAAEGSGDVGDPGARPSGYSANRVRPARQQPSSGKKLQENGACDLAYYLPNLARFRASILRQRGSYAISMRVIPREVPNLETLRLPRHLGEVAHLKNGIVLLTGLAGSGKSSSVAALINAINEERAVEIHTIEDPIEFLHPHKKATILQREVYRDAPSFHVAMQAALRHFASVVFVSEMRDRETVELALEAAESGQLVLSTLRTADVAKTLERILGYFPATEQHALRLRLARNLRYIVSQRLIPRKDGAGREPICEIFISNAKTRGRVEKAEFPGKTLAYAMRECAEEGMQCFDDVLIKLLRSGVLDIEAVREFAGDLLEDPLEPVSRAAGLKSRG